LALSWLVLRDEETNEERLLKQAAGNAQGHPMDATPQTSQPEASRAFTIILERLYAMARQVGSPVGTPSDLEATLTALPLGSRSKVMLVLESVESRAQDRADAELAEAARAIRNAAYRVWRQKGSPMPRLITHEMASTRPARIQSYA